MKVHVYETWKWNGQEAESDEMRPQWWREDCIPYELTWKDDKFWLPLLLESKSFTGRSVLIDICAERLLAYLITFKPQVRLRG